MEDVYSVCAMCAMATHGATGPNSSKYGHNKGVVGIDNDTASGFWLVHSVPQSFGVTNGTLDGCVHLPSLPPAPHACSLHRMGQCIDSMKEGLLSARRVPRRTRSRAHVSCVLFLCSPNARQLFLLLWLSVPSGFLVVLEKPNRSSFTFTFTHTNHP